MLPSKAASRVAFAPVTLTLAIVTESAVAAPLSASDSQALTAAAPSSWTSCSSNFWVLVLVQLAGSESVAEAWTTSSIWASGPLESLPPPVESLPPPQAERASAEAIRRQGTNRRRFKGTTVLSSIRQMNCDAQASSAAGRRPAGAALDARRLIHRSRAAVELGEPALELGDALGEALDRLGDRVGEVDPVGVGALDPAPLHPHRVAGIADHGGPRRHVLYDDRVGADLGVLADRDRTQELRPGANRDVVAEGRVALAALEAGATQGHPLVEGHPGADPRRLADHHAGAVVDEEFLADLGGGVDL